MGGQVLSQAECADNSAGQAVVKDNEAFSADTDELASLCQKQVNFWHNRKVLSEDQISSINKLAKLSILNRNKGLVSVVSILAKGLPGPL
jgi:hypothetical protein